MARIACKIIIDGLTRAMMDSLEEIFASPLVRDVMLPAEECDNYLDELVGLDLSLFQEAGFIHRSVLRIVDDLVNKGVIVPEIWTILAKPGDPINPNPGDTTSTSTGGTI